MRELLRHALMRRGYQVETGCTGAEGMALCESLEPPDLLITDLILPGATGPAIAERLRQRAPSVKVLLMYISASQSINELCQYTPHGLLRTYSSAQPPRATLVDQRPKTVYFPRMNDVEDAGSLSIFS